MSDKTKIQDLKEFMEINGLYIKADNRSNETLINKVTEAFSTFETDLRALLTDDKQFNYVLRDLVRTYQITLKLLNRQ